ncbi:MAG: hypothetical protein EOM53_06095 [Alphaproteobacteria bacterium]|nr:hypothetical protein [Alphaproteobacteria bacterium]
MKKRIFWALITFLIIIISLLVYFFMGNKPLAENITWGVNFSQKQALDLSLEPKEIYIDMLDNLKVRNIKIAMHWDLIEKTQDSFDMEDFDFYMEEAKKRDAKVILAIGIKTPRWPEYHMPSWLEDLTKEEQQEDEEMDKDIGENDSKQEDVDQREADEEEKPQDAEKQEQEQKNQENLVENQENEDQQDNENQQDKPEVSVKYEEPDENLDNFEEVQEQNVSMQTQNEEDVNLSDLFD